MAEPKLVVFLYLFVVASLADVCQKKICSCTYEALKKNSDRKYHRVNCRSRGLTKVFPQSDLPKNTEILDLAKNSIRVIKRGFLEDHFKLERLYLQKNKIKLLEEKAFVGLDGLKVLNIGQNKLKNLEAQAFLGLRELKILDLKHNEIKNIDKDAFVGLESLTKLNLQNSNLSTIVNGTLRGLSTLEKINIKYNPLRCDCRLNWLSLYLTRKGAPKVVGTCLRGNDSKKLTSLKKVDLCEKPPELLIYPSESQIVAIGDRFRIKCEVVSKQKRTLRWTKNHTSWKDSKRLKILDQRIGFNEILYVEFVSITMEDLGLYTCVGEGLVPKAITVQVVTSKKMCSRDVTNGKERMLWPVTVQRSTASLRCPWPNNQKNYTSVRRPCEHGGVWGPIDLGNCRLEPLSKKLGLLSQMLDGPDSKNIGDVTKRLEMLTDPSSYTTAKDISLVKNVLSRIISKDVANQGKVFTDIMTSFDNLMELNMETIYASAYEDGSPFKLSSQLELMSRKMLNNSATHVMRNFMLASVYLENPESKKNITCYIFFKSYRWSQPRGVSCEPSDRKDYSLSITIPWTIFESSRSSGHRVVFDHLKIRFLVYRLATFFPKVRNTEGALKDKNVSSNVLSIQIPNIKQLNLSDPLVLKFRTKPGTEPIVSQFNFIKTDGGHYWSSNTDCTVTHSTAVTATVECKHLVNKNIAIMSHLGIASNLAYPIEIVVYLGAVVTSLLLVATLTTFIFARDLRFNRDDVIMMMNACLSLLVVILSFAFGIDRTQNGFVCRVMGMFLHFFFFASLLWLGCYIMCVSRRLNPPAKDPGEEVINPVLKYYIVSWALPAIICGMTMAIDVNNYKKSDYCWLNESSALGGFVGPACLLFIVNAVLLVRLHLLVAHGVPHSSSNNAEPEDERLQLEEPDAMEEIVSASASEENEEKSNVTLSLVATWVVMSLIYLNFILAYFLLSARTVKLRWIFLSYIYALANIALGCAIFGFHCASRSEVREAWKQKWNRVLAIKVNFFKSRMPKLNTVDQRNGGVAAREGTHRLESDRQSNITLPSSAALTNDVFVNGRPMSTARLSLLDEVDLPAEAPQAAAAGTEVDVTETENKEEESRRSLNSIHSERKSKSCDDENSQVLPFLPEANLDGAGNSFQVPSETHANHVDITEDVTSTTVADELSHDSTQVNNASNPHLDPTSSYGQRQFPMTNQMVYPHPCHQYLPVHQSFPPGQPPLLILPQQTLPPLMDRPPPSYQRAIEMASQSSSSFGDNSGLSRSNSKRKRPSEAQGYRNEPVGARAQMQAQPQTPNVIGVARPNDSTNACNSAHQNAGPSNSKPVNRYRDGRVKPEPKEWNGCREKKIAYVPIPHVSKIHREPLHNETSV